MSRHAALACALMLLVPAGALAGFYKYVDDSGTVHIVDDPDLVPPRYRDRASEAMRAPEIQIQEGLRRVPGAAAPSPAAHAPGFATDFHEPIRIARLRLRGDDAQAGSWFPSTELAPKSRIHVIVAASWCPSCMSLFKQVAMDPSLRSAVDMVLFYEDEAQRRPGRNPDSVLTYPEHISRYSLPYYLARRGSFGGLVTSYPTILRCDAGGCRKLSRASFTRQYATR